MSLGCFLGSILERFGDPNWKPNGACLHQNQENVGPESLNNRIDQSQNAVAEAGLGKVWFKSQHRFAHRSKTMISEVLTRLDRPQGYGARLNTQASHRRRTCEIDPRRSDPKF